MKQSKIEKIWLTETEVWIRDSGGKEVCEPIAEYPRLRDASAEQRQNFEIDESGIHWPHLDEDLSYEGFFNKSSKNKLYALFMAHPELNASAIARRLGISQSLFAQYISGQKTPSAKREKAILDEIRLIGEELSQMKH